MSLSTGVAKNMDEHDGPRLILTSAPTRALFMYIIFSYLCIPFLLAPVQQCGPSNSRMESLDSQAALEQRPEPLKNIKSIMSVTLTIILADIFFTIPAILCTVSSPQFPVPSPLLQATKGFLVNLKPKHS